MTLPSGRQHLLRLGDHEAVVTEVGGGLRRYDVAGQEVVDGFVQDALCDGGRGQTLLPWPNRVAGGRWSWDGADLQLPLTEAKAGNAIHGLTRWLSWELVESTTHSAHLRVRLAAQPGWPFPLLCELRYALGPDGLTVDTLVTNTGTTVSPAAAGAHPYLSARGHVDDCVVTVPATTWRPTDERGIPTGVEAVEGTDRDFRSARPVGGLLLDTAYGGLLRAPDGRVRVDLARPDGSSARLWAGEGYEHLQVFSGDTLAPHRRRQGLAVEPMTSPPNALQTKEDLPALEPGETLALQWGITPG
ncbi:MAG: aldose 1-epimerase family protein [Mycobacteriales bacterium]